MLFRSLLVLALTTTFGCPAKAPTGSTTPVNGSDGEPKAETKTDSQSAAFAGSYSNTPSGLATVQEKKLWKQGVESLEGQIQRITERCGVTFSVDIDYASFKPVLGDRLPSIAHVMGHCEAIVGGFQSQCTDDDLKQSIQAHLKSVLCTYDAEAKTKVLLSFENGVYRGGFSRISENVYNDSYQWLNRNLPPAP